MIWHVTRNTMENEMNESIAKLSEYISFMNPAVNSLKAASLVGREKDVVQVSHQIEAVLNEIDREVSNLKMVDLKEEAVKRAVDAKVFEVLYEAAQSIERRNKR